MRTEISATCFPSEIGRFIDLHRRLRLDAPGTNRKEISMIEPLAYTIPDACNASAASRSAIYRAVKNGELTLRKRGKRSLILADELRRWLQSLPVASNHNT